MAKEGLEFQIDKLEFERLVKFAKTIVKDVERAGNETIKNLAVSAEVTLHKKLTNNDVPGPALSQSWVDFKRKRGFFTTKLQRFGRGDKRSFYEQIKRRRAPGTGGRTGWFVGIVNGTPAYDNSGRIKKDDMVSIMRSLQERWPLFKDVLNEVFKDAAPMFLSVLSKRLNLR